MRRGTNSRVRRRQSDAKWRASVASCYETLKYVIPDSNKLPKRKISKAVILQATDKHISELEKALSSLFTQEANRLKKTVFWKKGKQWLPASLDNVRNDFEEKQALLFEQSAFGRRRYSMLADIEEEILHMVADPDRMTVISNPERISSNQQLVKTSILSQRRADVKSAACKPLAHSTPNLKKTVSHTVGLSTTESCRHSPSVICEQLHEETVFEPSAFDPDILLQRDPLCSLNTPAKVFCQTDDSDLNEGNYNGVFDTPVYVGSQRIDTKPPLTSPRLSKVAKQLDFATEINNSPIKECRNLVHLDGMTENHNLLGFTPIKLPSDSEQGATPLRFTDSFIDRCKFSPSAQTPALHRTTYPPQTPKAVGDDDCLYSDDEETKSLLCLETFDMEPDYAELERTPDKRMTKNEDEEETDRIKKCKRKISFASRAIKMKKAKRQTPKCRRNLEKLYPEEDAKEIKDMPLITGVFDKDLNCSDFDGYFLFYRQVVDELLTHQQMSRVEIASPSVATVVSQMWCDMSSADKETLATLAALEGSQDSNASSGLSDDLQSLDVKPLDSSHFIDANRIGLLKKDMQTVPNGDLKTLDSRSIQKSSNNQEVPVDFNSVAPFTETLQRETADDISLSDLNFNHQESPHFIGFEDLNDTDKHDLDMRMYPSFWESSNNQVVPAASSIVKKDVLLSSSQSSAANTSLS